MTITLSDETFFLYPENIEKLWFSNVFKRYINKPEISNGLKHQRIADATIFFTVKISVFDKIISNLETMVNKYHLRFSNYFQFDIQEIFTNFY